jgi:hypothetical protein
MLTLGPYNTVVKLMTQIAKIEDANPPWDWWGLFNVYRDIG